MRNNPTLDKLLEYWNSHGHKHRPFSLDLCRGCFFSTFFPISCQEKVSATLCAGGDLVNGGCSFLPAEIGVVNPRQSYSIRRGGVLPGAAQGLVSPVSTLNHAGYST